jgi:DNA-binding transcriptional LysR family regulator
MLAEIQTFLDVVKNGSFSAVARQRNVAVSSITRQIDVLETSLGERLLHRSSRKLLLTDAGHLFFPRATAISSEMEEARLTLQDAQSEPRGELTITAPTAFGRRHAMPALRSFLQRYPGIELDLHLGDAWVDLTATRFDVAIRMGVLPDSDLIATPLAPMRRLVCASPAYLAVHGRPQIPEDLLQHSCLTMSSFNPAGCWSFPDVNKGRPLAVRGRLRTDDSEALLDAATGGLGIVHLASWLVSDSIVSGQLECLFSPATTTATWTGPSIHAVWLAGRSRARVGQLLIAHLRQAFGAPAYWDKALG